LTAFPFHLTIPVISLTIVPCCERDYSKKSFVFL
jgi:hypothetical protein